MEVSLFCLAALVVILLFFIWRQRKRIHEQDKEITGLWEQSAQMELVLNSCSTFPWIYVPKNRLLAYLSKERVALYPEKLTLDFFVRNYIHQDFQDKVFAAVEEVVTGKSPELNVKVKVISVDGRGEQWAHIFGLPVGWDEGQGTIARLIGINRYVTKEILQELELKESKEFLELTMRNANIVPWEYLPDQDLLTIKSSTRKELAEPILMADYVRLLVHPDWKDCYTQELAALKDGRRDCLDYKLKVMSEGGEYEWIRVVGTVLDKDENGRPLRVIGACYQIDQEMRREEQLDRLRGAEEANRLKTAFISNISHEIRTPLNAIVGFSQLMVESPGESAEFLPIIETNNNLLLKLVGDILDISRIESGDLNLSYREINLNDVMENLFNTYSYQMPREVQLIKKWPEESFILDSDKNRLMQVMNNFLNNALKFTQSGYITMGYEALNETQIRFFVLDTGKGISSQDQKHVFERFTKLDSFVQGTGLGLSVCEMIVEKMGGMIGVQSQPNQGSEFWFMLPIHPVQ